MILKGFRKEMSRHGCNPSFETLGCIAYLDQDISPALPYVNALLEGDSWTDDPPSLTLKVQGKIITVYGDRITVNALHNEEEADKIVGWIQNEINLAWDNRENIIPKTEGRKLPEVFELLKLLPGTNCKVCGQPSCMAFAALLREGEMDVSKCRPLSQEKQTMLAELFGG